jgi:flagellar FliJ protein
VRKFVFSLESVLKSKEVFEHQKIKELAHLLEMKGRLITELTYLRERWNRLFADFSDRVKMGVTVAQIKVHSHYLSCLRDIIDEKENVLSDYKRSEAAMRLQLMEIRRDKKMLETLKEKKFQEYLLEQKAEEERFIDELVSFRETSRSLTEVL